MNFIHADLNLIAFMAILSSGFLGACSDEGGSWRIEPDNNQAGQCDDILILTAIPAELAPL